MSLALITPLLDRFDAALAHKPVRYSLYGLLIVLALLILASLNTFPVLVDDAQYYHTFGQDIASGYYGSILNNIRTYGYPVFLALCIHLAWLINAPDLNVIVGVQIALHIVNAWAALRLAKILLKDTCRPWITLFVFALVVLNPYLLAMTTQVLTDSLTALGVTAFMLLLARAVDSHSLRASLATGFMFGVCYVIRPFHLMWGIGLLAGAALLYGPFLRSSWGAKIPAFKRRLTLRKAICMAVAGLVMVFSQLVFTLVAQQPYGRTFNDALVSFRDSGALYTHRLGAGYFYRYETYGAPEALAGGPTDRTLQYYSRTLKADPGNPQRFIMPVIKAISLFQQHDYPTYRPHAGLTSPTAFAIGLVLWCLYCYTLPCALWEVWRAFPTRQPAPLRSLMVYGLSLYLALYAVPTIPEPRYIDPIYAVLIVIACLYAHQEKRWWPLILSITVGIITYLLTAQVILDFVVVGYPLFP